jgi:outer membrane protein assembly factor BamB
MHAIRRLLAVGLLAVFGPVLALAEPAPAAKDVASWLLFHGNPRQTGVAEGKLPAKLVTLWTFKAEDAFESAVAVADGLVFAGSMDEHVYALDLKTGARKWKFKAGPFKSAPSVRDGRVTIGDLDGTVYCLDAAKGTKKWEFAARAEVGGANFHGADTLVASHDEHLYCLDKDGKERWKFKTDGPIYGSVAIGDGKTFLVGCDSQMHVLDVGKGKQESSVDLESQSGATAAILGDRLYVGTMKNEVRAIDWKKGETVWTYKGKRGGQGFFSSPAVTDKYVVIGGRDKFVHCIDRKTGLAAWTFPTGDRVDSSPVVVGGRVVVGSMDSNVYVLDLAKGTLVQKIAVDGAVAGSPAVVAGRVLIGTQKGTLYCLGEK